MNVASFVDLQKDLSKALLSQLLQKNSDFVNTWYFFDCVEEVFEFSFDLKGSLMWTHKTQLDQFKLIVLAED